MVKKEMSKTHDYVSYFAVLKMSAAVRKTIAGKNNRLYVSLRRCKVTDRYHVKQCYHCQRPGHMSNQCPDKKDNALPTCLYCSGSHPSGNCPDKSSEMHRKCANCLRSRNPKMVNGAKSHTAASRECPIIQLYLRNIKMKTVDWQEKKPLI